MPKSARTICAILIDPFQEALHLVALPKSTKAQLERMHELLDCELVEAVSLDSGLTGGAYHVLWVDESGLLREPFIYPQFVCSAYSPVNPLTGYGLITSLGSGGSNDDCVIPIPRLAEMVRFEQWRKRLSPDLFIDQLLRIYLK
jgi:hypothetical protein